MNISSSRNTLNTWVNRRSSDLEMSIRSSGCLRLMSRHPGLFKFTYRGYINKISLFLLSLITETKMLNWNTIMNHLTSKKTQVSRTVLKYLKNWYQTNYNETWDTFSQPMRTLWTRFLRRCSNITNGVLL